jgi:hypothetical protein
MTTLTLESKQLPNINDQVFKSNLDFLMKNNTREEIKVLAKSLGEQLIKKGRRLKKEELCVIILKNKKFTLKNLEELEEINKKDDYENKVKYYEELKERLFKDTKEVENENYEKPCLVFEGFDQISIKRKGYYKWIISYCIYNNIFVEDLKRVNQGGEQMDICHGHNCPKNCIEPTHLSLKTKSENNYEDKIRDGTLSQGEKHSRSKISEDLALQIKHSKGDGRTQQQRAKDFNVTIDIIKHLDRNNSSWKYLPDKDGVIKETKDIKEENKKIKERKNKSKQKEFTVNDWEDALKRLKERSIDSEEFAKNGKVNTKCWLFQGCLSLSGYGKITFKLIDYNTHVLAWEAINQRKQDNKDLVVRHLCDIRNCCNPEHLKLGTRNENVIDFLTYSKGTKLNEDKVREIKKLLADGNLKHREIAQKFNISTCTITQICNKKAWSHVV